MGDRTDCYLTLRGLISASDLSELIEMMQGHYLSSNPQRARSQFFEVDENLHFDEVNYGRLRDEVYDFLISRKISFTWAWGNGGGYSSGVLFHDAEEGKTRSFATSDRDVVLRLEEVGDPEIIRFARKADRGIFWNLLIYESAHDLLVKLGENKEMRNFHDAVNARAA